MALEARHHDMDMAPKKWYEPLLKTPVLLHSSRDPGNCTLTPERCAYKTRYWVFWYEADHVFSLPTVYFFLSVIALFTITRFASEYAPKRLRTSSPWRRATAAARYLSYKMFRLPLGGRNSQSLGAYLLLGVGIIFFAAMTLGPQPYYWPTDAHYGNSPPIATRTGWMALACLPFVLLLSAKANMITALTGIPHEKLNVWHNWVSWAMFVLALIHTFPFIVFHQYKQDLHKTFVKGGVWLTGVIALLAQAWLTGMSISWIRNRFYEFFKATHFFFAIVFIVFFFLHCSFILTSWDYIIAAVVLYCTCLVYTWLKTYIEHGIRHKASLRLETPHSLRISIHTRSAWRPGQHLFLRFLSGDAHSLTAHPYTVCAMPPLDHPFNGGNLVFYVQPRGGLTRRLAARAESASSSTGGATIPVLIEGPYGGMPARWSGGFDRTLLVAGGSGCGFTLALIEDWIRNRPSCCARLHVVLATRDPEMRIWYIEELQRLADHHSVKNLTEIPGLTVHFYETGPVLSSLPQIRGGESPASSSDDEERKTGGVAATDVEKQQHTDETSSVASLFGVKFFRGRPDTADAVNNLAVEDGVTVGVTVCGPFGMVYDVSSAASAAQRRILAGREGASELWLHKEAFSY